MLYEHARIAFEEEVSRFSRLEDKAGRFITVISSLLAIYALAGRQLFSSLFPISGVWSGTKVTLAGLIMLSLLASWNFAFQALRLQGTRKHPLNEEVFGFFRKNNPPTIQWAMSKRYCEATHFNRKVNDQKATNLKKCFISIVIVVVCFSIFVILMAIDKNMSDTIPIEPQAVENSSTYWKKVV